LDGSSSNSSSSTNLHAAAVVLQQSQQQQDQHPARRPTPGELCVRRDIGDALVNGQLQIITSQADTYIYGPANATLRQIEPNRFLFKFAATAAGVLVNQAASGDQQLGGFCHQTAHIGGGSSGVVTISISIPKRYPHHPPSLTIVPGSSFLFPRTGHSVSNIVVEQQRLVNLILTRPCTSHYGASPGHQHQQHQYLWSPVHRLNDVLDWILHDFTVAAGTARCEEPRVVADHIESPQQQQQQQHQHSQLRMEHPRFRK
jgi:ubiquitin-protein ligase